MKNQKITVPGQVFRPRFTQKLYVVENFFDGVTGEEYPSYYHATAAGIPENQIMVKASHSNGKEYFYGGILYKYCGPVL